MKVSSAVLRYVTGTSSSELADVAKSGKLAETAKQLGCSVEQLRDAVAARDALLSEQAQRLHSAGRASRADRAAAAASAPTFGGASLARSPLAARFLPIEPMQVADDRTAAPRHFTARSPGGEGNGWTQSCVSRSVQNAFAALGLGDGGADAIDELLARVQDEAPATPLTERERADLRLPVRWAKGELREAADYVLTRSPAGDVTVSPAGGLMALKLAGVDYRLPSQDAADQALQHMKSGGAVLVSDRDVAPIGAAVSDRVPDEAMNHVYLLYQGPDGAFRVADHNMSEPAPIAEEALRTALHAAGRSPYLLTARG